MHEAWHDGVFRPSEDISISVDSAAFRYGRVVFDAARAVVEPSAGRVHLIGVPQHLARFRASCAALGLPLPYTGAELERVAVELVRRNAPTAVCGLRWFAWSTARGFAAAERVSVCVFLVSLKGYASDRPVRIGISAHCRSAAGDLPRRIKATSHYVFARWATLHAGSEDADEVVFLNEHGHVTESARASLLVVREHALLAPPPSEGVLPGVTRSLLRHLAETELGLEWVEEPLLPDHLTAGGALLCSSSLGVVPVFAADGVSLPRPASLGALIRVYEDATRGRLPDLDDWVRSIRLP